MKGRKRTRAGAGNRWRGCAAVVAGLLPVERWHPAVREYLSKPSRCPGGPWAVALSGGADSLSLLLALWNLAQNQRRRLLALHFNHRLRGRAAAADERFCRQVCRGLGVRFVAGRWRRAPQRPSEEEARLARFAFFDSALRRAGARALWLGHHQNDIAESILMRLARGSGTAGLAAPRPVQRVQGRLHLRPLLTFKKRDLVAALRRASAPWRDDATNATDVHFRNRVRHHVLPAWGAAAGRDVVAGAALARDLMEEDDSALETWLAELRPRRPGGALDLGLLKRRPRALVRRALRRWLVDHPLAGDLSRQGFEDLLEVAMAGRPTRRSLGRHGFAVIRGDRLRFERSRRKRAISGGSHE